MDPIDPVAQFLGEYFGDGNVHKQGSHQLEMHVGHMEYYFVLDADLNCASNFRGYNTSAFKGSLYDAEFFPRLQKEVELWLDVY